MATPRPLHALITSSGSPAAASSSHLVAPPVLALADPPVHTVDARLVELLADEMVRALRLSERAARQRRTRDHRAVEEELEALGLAGPPPRGGGADSSGPHRGGSVMDDRDNGNASASTEDANQEEADEAVCARLDVLGFTVGWATAERLARDRPRFPSTSVPAPAGAPAPAPAAAPPSTAPDPLEVVKFICKDVWTALYDKQVDNLRTNHRGVYVLLDQSLRSLRALSVPEEDSRDEELEAQRWVKAVLAFPSGIIRGALSNLGVHATVTGESVGWPQATFQIKTGRPGGP